MYPTRIIKISTGFGRTISLNLINRFLLIVILCEYADLDGEISRTPRPPNPLTNRAAYDGPKKKKTLNDLPFCCPSLWLCTLNTRTCPPTRWRFWAFPGRTAVPRTGCCRPVWRRSRRVRYHRRIRFYRRHRCFGTNTLGGGQTERKKTIISVFPPLIVLGKIMSF